MWPEHVGRDDGVAARALHASWAKGSAGLGADEGVQTKCRRAWRGCGLPVGERGRIGEEGTGEGARAGGGSTGDNVGAGAQGADDGGMSEGGAGDGWCGCGGLEVSCPQKLTRKTKKAATHLDFAHTDFAPQSEYTRRGACADNADADDKAR